MATKRTAPLDESSDDSSKPLCKWGPLCYRKNIDHLQEFAHPHRTAAAAKAKPGDMNKAKAIPAKIARPPAFPSTDSPAKKFGAPSTPPKPKHLDAAFLESCYDLLFPEDLFDLWSVCSELNPDNPREALAPLLGYRLVGPFDALALKGIVDSNNKRAFNLHYRYYYDPPEFQTVLVDVASDCHIGYFRDDPSEQPVFVAQSQLHRKDVQPWKLLILGSNLIQVIHNQIKEQIKKTKDEDDQKATLEQVLEIVSRVSQNKHLLSYKSKRKARAVGNVMHHVGMVVPYDDKTEIGYRPLTVTNVELRRMMQNVASAQQSQVKTALAPIQDIVTLVNFANDECDYGMGLELGLDLFLFGNERLHSTALFLLQTAYTLLQRTKFVEIIKDHLAARKTEDYDYLSKIAASDGEEPDKE
ncbi:histone PARylation factor 1-like isoform X2 [Varroa jacobsoni]|nr:histone PARylation factor 1-like isoform X2 [Varroa destructor]XP_022709185.1 histone PARylation factor 1-like isoform X2 [Varroa jacobsoni]